MLRHSNPLPHNPNAYITISMPNSWTNHHLYESPPFQYPDNPYFDNPFFENQNEFYDNDNSLLTPTSQPHFADDKSISSLLTSKHHSHFAANESISTALTSPSSITDSYTPTVGRGGNQAAMATCPNYLPSQKNIAKIMTQNVHVLGKLDNTVPSCKGGGMPPIECAVENW